MGAPFFPRRLDPVLNGGEGDKDAMIAPEMPGRRTVRQAVFGHEAHGQQHDTTGVAGVRIRQVEGVGAKIAVTGGAVVLREGEGDNARATRGQVAQVVEPSGTDPIPIGRVATNGTAPMREIPGPRYDHGWGKVFHPRDSFGRIAHVLAGTGHALLLQIDSCLPEVIGMRRPSA
jgi:hypothetical protein